MNSSENHDLQDHHRPKRLFRLRHLHRERTRLFAMGDDGVATAVAETDDPGAALEAAQGCPMGAITVLDEDGNVLR